MPHVHTPHSLGLWKKQLMERDFPDNAATFEKKYNFTQRINEERLLYRHCDEVIATTPDQLDMIVNDYGAPSGNVHMIPPGYDDNRFFPISAASRNAVRDAVIMVLSSKSISELSSEPAKAKLKRDRTQNELRARREGR